jgi:hypothetical protein
LYGLHWAARLRGLETVETKYGFTYEVTEDGHEFEALQTGDGMTQFCDVMYDDGRVGIAFVYGIGNGIIGELTVFETPKTLKELDAKWVILFEKPETIDSLISQLEDIKQKLIP